ncbi:unnamed protein product [Thelazia callipaeda]|uniref:Uncharacterized protein n=1 Tax=Thelazia callipaeda TaxID=103827 RepID=A0A0N5D6F2_THECL|nr:unnamed protein product [Thelazia callipaeda]
METANNPNPQHYWIVQQVNQLPRLATYEQYDPIAKPRFRLNNMIREHERAQLSWLTGRDAHSQLFFTPPRAHLLHWTSNQPTMLNNRQYRGITSTDQQQLPPIYYPNIRTMQPTAYQSNNLQHILVQPASFAQFGYIPMSTMLSAIHSILSILKETIDSKNGNAESNSVTASGEEKENSLPDDGGVETEEAENKNGTMLVHKLTALEKKSKSEIDKNYASSGMTSTSVNESATDDGSNLLESLLRGRLDKIDWIGSLLGTNQLPNKEEGSAFAEIFQGGIFGPAN